MGKKKNGKQNKDKKYRQEDNLWLWENKHILGKIEEGLKSVEQNKGTVTKKLKKAN